MGNRQWEDPFRRGRGRVGIGPPHHRSTPPSHYPHDSRLPISRLPRPYPLLVLIVDVFNVLHQTGVLPPELAGMELVDLAWALERSRYAGRAAVLVCDGVRPGVGHTGPSQTRIGEARVLYAGAGRDADTEIEKLIESSSFPGRLLVVSSDKRIGRAARRRKSPWMKSDRFLEEIAEDFDRREREPLPKWVHEIPLSPGAVDEWLETFGLDRGAAAEDLIQQDERERAARLEAARQERERIRARVRGDAGERRGAKKNDPAPESRGGVDGELKELMDQHGEGIDPDELDMGRWLGGA